MTTPPSLDEIQLDQLYIHPMNPRQTVSDQMIEDKAASIAVSGLMQNLLGYRDPEHPEQIGIVAGGIRLRGLQKLQTEGWSRHETQTPANPVPVLITSDPMLAQSWAAGENIGREALNPADEVRAYAAMRDQGNSPDMIARAFGKSGTHVARRLKLADLPKAAIDALAEGTISLDTARELTLARDKASAQLVLDAAIKDGWNARQVRAALTKDTISSTDGRALYVGIPAYIEAGGTMTEDLFSDDQVLHDEKLLDQVFRDMLTAACAREKDEGGWAEVRPMFENRWADYGKSDGMDRIHRERIELPEADADELDAQLDKPFHERDQARINELQARMVGDVSDDDREHGIMFLYVDGVGLIRTHGPYRKPAPKSAKGDDTVTSSTTPEKPLYPANLTEDLSRIQLATLQTAILDKPELALDLLAYQIECACPSYRGALAVTFESPSIAPTVEEGTHIDARLTDVPSGPSFEATPTPGGFSEFQDKGKKHRNTVLTHRLARSINAASTGAPLLQFLQAEMGAQRIRKIWTPTASNFFSRVRADYLDRIWAELLELDETDERRGEFARLKKGEKAKELQALFEDASVQEAHGLSRAQIAAIDAWVPEGMSGGDA